MEDKEYREWLLLFDVYGFGNPHGGVGRGWWPLIARLLNDLSIMGFSKENLHINQVKEKFGGLRFYVSGKDIGQFGNFNSEVNLRISQAEHESYSTCEQCGGAGQLRDGNWLKTLCNEHAGGRKVTSFDDLVVNF